MPRASERREVRLRVAPAKTRRNRDSAANFVRCVARPTANLKPISKQSSSDIVPREGKTPAKAREGASLIKRRSVQQHALLVSGLQTPHHERCYGAIHVNGSSTAIVGDVHCDHYHINVSTNAQLKSLAALTGSYRPATQTPTSLFERLPSFKPGKYTSENVAPDLYVYFGREIATTNDARLGQLCVVYTDVSGNRVQLSIFIVITHDCDLWDFVRFNQPVLPYNKPLPHCLVSKIRSCVESVDEIAQDSHYTITAG